MFLYALDMASRPSIPSAPCLFSISFPFAHLPPLLPVPRSFSPYMGFLALATPSRSPSIPPPVCTHSPHCPAPLPRFAD
ncbi:hypothetical protein C8R44DRAFT_797246 [Mycena epipterygia]|nr:hypothetical protein C8R44DRAFT_797246 [Mycena epipterygia]